MIELINSLVGGLCVAIPSVIASVLNSRSNREVILWRIQKLEEKVEKHNTFDSRLIKIEKDIEHLKRGNYENNK